ncbi:MAG: HlyD family efflux transporter periplasmic adaptor subunit [Pseudomonadota bacterium]
MRFIRHSITGLFLASLTMGLLIYAGYIVYDALQDRWARANTEAPARERVFVVDLVTARSGVETPVLETFGEIKTRRTLELRAAVSGRVVGLAPNFEDGGKVETGDVLVAIDPADLKSEYDRMTADLADAQAEVRDADRGLELANLEKEAAEQQSVLRDQSLSRQLGLADRGVGSAASVETAELEAAAAEAVVIARTLAVAQAEARVDQAATHLTRAEIALEEVARDLEDTTIEAPFSGTLSATSVVEGGLIAANERLADLIDPQDLEVAFRVSNAQYARLLDNRGRLVGADVAVILDVAGADLQATGRLNRVSAETGEGLTGRLVFAGLDSAFGFRPGDFVTVKVKEPQLDNVVRLPATAVDASGEVLVLSGADRLEALQVELLRRQGDDVLVRSPELEGREVVKQRTPLLGNGVAVKPLRPKETALKTDPALLQLSDHRRARLVTFVLEDAYLPEDAKARMLSQLAEPQVPAQMVARLERRMGG